MILRKIDFLGHMTAFSRVCSVWNMDLDFANMVADILKHEESEKKTSRSCILKPDVRPLDLKCQNGVENDEFPEFVQKCLELSFLMHFIEFSVKNNVDSYSQIFIL